jgi:hypothetical protein
VRHLRAVASSYNVNRARAERGTLVKTLDIPFTRAELLGFEKPARPQGPGRPAVKDGPATLMALLYARPLRFQTKNTG